MQSNKTPDKIVISDMQKGLIAFVLGIILLLYTLGIVTAGINVVFIVFSCALIGYGAKKAELYEKVMHLIKQHKPK